LTLPEDELFISPLLTVDLLTFVFRSIPFLLAAASDGLLFMSDDLVLLSLV